MRYTYVRQHDSTDCAAASLAMVCLHYKKEITITRLRDMMGTDMKGTNLVGLQKAANELGFSTAAVRVDRENFLSDFTLPAIAQVITDQGLTHFVVIFKKTTIKDDDARRKHVVQEEERKADASKKYKCKDYVVIGDPANELKKISLDEFYKNFTGVLLLLEKLWLGKYLERLPKALRWLLCMIIVCIGWVMFDLTDFAQMRCALARMFRFTHVALSQSLAADVSIVPPLLWMIPALVFATPVCRRVHLGESYGAEIVRNVDLDIREGEILGIGGLAGQGKLGIPNGVMGLYEAGGTVEFDGKPIPLNAPRRCLDAQLAFVSEDRRGVGLLLDESLEWNIAFPAMQIHDKFLKSLFGGLVKWRDEKAIRAVTDRYIDELKIKCTSSKQKAKELSGGNQQKVCLAKAFALEPKFLFVSEPTRGIDVGAKSLVLDALKRFNRESGITVVMISSELEELRMTCDRIAIVSGGRIAGILPATESSEAFGMLMVSQVK